MVRPSWKMAIGLVLVGLSILLGLAHVALFGEPRTLAFNLGVGIVFVPVQVLLVTLIIERLLNEREKQALIKKLNMVIGAFMSEVGAGLLRRVDAFCGEEPDLARNLAVTTEWGRVHYRKAVRFAEDYQAQLATDAGQLAELREFLLDRRPFILGLLQNPNLLEHDTFTDLLWAVCHLTEELEARKRFRESPGDRPPAPLRRHPAGQQHPDPGVARLHATPAARLSLHVLPGHPDEPLQSRGLGRGLLTRSDPWTLDLEP